MATSSHFTLSGVWNRLKDWWLRFTPVVYPIACWAWKLWELSRGRCPASLTGNHNLTVCRLYETCRNCNGLEPAQALCSNFLSRPKFRCVYIHLEQYLENKLQLIYRLPTTLIEQCPKFWNLVMKFVIYVKFSPVWKSWMCLCGYQSNQSNQVRKQHKPVT